MLMFLMTLAMAGGQQANSSELQLSFDTRGKSGEIVVALFNSEADWKQRNTPVRTLKVQTGHPVRFEDLPPGRYGIMAFLDRNRDGRLNTLPIGLPTEPYGFSRNARGTFGPPGWGAAAFDVRGDTVSPVITLR